MDATLGKFQHAYCAPAVLTLRVQHSLSRPAAFCIMMVRTRRNTHRWSSLRPTADVCTKTGSCNKNAQIKMPPKPCIARRGRSARQESGEGEGEGEGEADGGRGRGRRSFYTCHHTYLPPTPTVSLPHIHSPPPTSHHPLILLSSTYPVPILLPSCCYHGPIDYEQILLFHWFSSISIDFH